MQESCHDAHVSAFAVQMNVTHDRMIEKIRRTKLENVGGHRAKTSGKRRVSDKRRPDPFTIIFQNSVPDTVFHLRRRDRHFLGSRRQD